MLGAILRQIPPWFQIITLYVTIMRNKKKLLVNCWLIIEEAVRARLSDSDEELQSLHIVGEGPFIGMLPSLDVGR